MKENLSKLQIINSVNQPYVQEEARSQQHEPRQLKGHLTSTSHTAISGGPVKNEAHVTLACVHPFTWRNNCWSRLLFSFLPSPPSPWPVDHPEGVLTKSAIVTRARGPRAAASRLQRRRPREFHERAVECVVLLGPSRARPGYATPLRRATAWIAYPLRGHGSPAADEN